MKPHGDKIGEQESNKQLNKYMIKCDGSNYELL